MFKKILILLIILLLISSNLAIAEDTKTLEKKPINNNLLDLKIELLMKIARIPSLSICIINNNSETIYKGYGFSNRFLKQVPNKNTIYKIGSITKTFTATAIMQLWEKELFNLDDDINDYLNFSVRNPNHPDIPITFRMLLAHHSSISPHSTNLIPQLYEGILYEFNLSRLFNNYPKYPYPWIKEFLTPGGKLYKSTNWLNISPGDEKHYSNANTILLELLIEILTNQSFEKYCQESIFGPLNMNNTSFQYSKLDKKNHATPYISIGGIYFPMRKKVFASTGAAGLLSNTEDLSHFLIAHMNSGEYKGEKILNNTTVELMHTVQFPDSDNFDQGRGFGLGWIINKNEKNGMIFEGHSGDILGGSGEMLMCKEKDLGFVLLSNRYSKRYQISNYWEIILELLETVV